MQQMAKEGVTCVACAQRESSGNEKLSGCVSVPKESGLAVWNWMLYAYRVAADVLKYSLNDCDDHLPRVCI